MNARQTVEGFGGSGETRRRFHISTPPDDASLLHSIMLSSKALSLGQAAGKPEEWVETLVLTLIERAEIAHDFGRETNFEARCGN